MSDQSSQKSRGGRPSKDPTGGRRPTITFRCRKGLQDKIQQAAVAAHRSISEEIESRLADSFGPNEAMKAAIREVLAERPQIEMRTHLTLSPAGLQALGGPVLRHLRHINAVPPTSGVGRIAFEN